MHPRLTMTVVAASAALLACTLALGAAAKPDHHHKPPKPKLELLTDTEQGVLRRGEVRVEVRSKRGEKAWVQAGLVVDGYPDDFSFRLGPRGAKLKEGDGVAHLGLSARQQEVLDFAIKSCRGASLAISATVGKRTGRLDAQLRMPANC